MMKKLHITIPTSPLHISAVMLTIGGIIFTVFAAPLYTPGQTLEPACAPGATDCTVSVGGGDYADGGEAGTADRTLGNTDNFDLGLETNDTTRLHIEGGGNVGIGTTNPTSTLHVEGSLSFQQTTITSTPTTLDSTHNVVFVNVSGDSTINLPAAASHTDKVYYIKKIDADNDEVTIDGNGSETIDGATTLVLYIQYDAVRIISDGSNWHIISDEIQPHVTKLRRNSQQLNFIPDTTDLIEFDTVDFDNAGLGTTGSSARVTVKRAGKYRVAGHVVTTTITADRYIYVGIRENGTLRRYNFNYAPTSSNMTSAVEDSYDLSAGDYVDLILNVRLNTGVDTQSNGAFLIVEEIR